jgi:hypothetical protein
MVNLLPVEKRERERERETSMKQVDGFITSMYNEFRVVPYLPARKSVLLGLRLERSVHEQRLEIFALDLPLEHGVHGREDGQINAAHVGKVDCDLGQSLEHDFHNRKIGGALGEPVT